MFKVLNNKKSYTKYTTLKIMIIW